MEFADSQCILSLGKRASMDAVDTIGDLSSIYYNRG